MPGFSNKLEYMHNRGRKPWSWQSVLTCIVSRQKREVLRWDRNRKLLIKETKRAGGERVLGVLVPPRDQFHRIEESTVSTATGTQGNKRKGAARKDKGKRPQRGPMKSFVCGAPHCFFKCPKWKSLLALAEKKLVQEN